jgi:hypothetical protein
MWFQALIDRVPTPRPLMRLPTDRNHHKRYQPSDSPLRIRVLAEQFGDVPDGRRLGFGLPSSRGT